MSEVGAEGAERPVVFECNDLQLCGLLHTPPGSSARHGVLVVVGGPQYRIGSHRQFVHLARTLAAAGHPVFRFDYRGMGDSEGDFRDFQDVNADIRAAIDAFQAACPVRNVVLWGLCDAASAAAFYGYHDERVSGLVMANPWVRTEAGEARTRMRHYYMQRLRSRDFWRKFLQMRWNPLKTLHELVGAVSTAFSHRRSSSVGEMDALPLPDQMRMCLERFGGRVMIILSGNDLTAREFEDTVFANKQWKQWLDRTSVSLHRIPSADHTFSTSVSRNAVALTTDEWLSEHDTR